MRYEAGKVVIEASCKACKLCVGACMSQAISFEEVTHQVDKQAYQDLLVYVEQFEGQIHPVCYELIGKALELAKRINQNVVAVMIGDEIKEVASSLYQYGVKDVFVYDHKEYRYFKMDQYTEALCDLIQDIKPNTILVGATNLGRSLAPRLAAHFKTGLTADCTVLEMKENSDLVQIRPAFGGNIMAQIITTHHRPQMATVRYKVMDKAKIVAPSQEAKVRLFKPTSSLFDILRVHIKETEVDISEADIIVVMGSGVKDEKGRQLVYELANHLKATVACTRPIVEKGGMSYLYQIGLSGRTCKPKLMITIGVSGAIQFTAGINGSETIIAINQDENAPIFKIAHFGIVDDLYDVLPKLNALIVKEKNHV